MGGSSMDHAGRASFEERVARISQKSAEAQTPQLPTRAEEMRSNLRYPVMIAGALLLGVAAFVVVQTNGSAEADSYKTADRGVLPTIIQMD